MWWEIVINNLPTFILLILAVFFIGAEAIKTLRVWKEAREENIRKKMAEQQQQINIQAEFEKLHERFDAVDERFNKVDEHFGKVDERLENTENRLEDLTVSDMHDIRAWIVQMHRKFYLEQGWIDAFSSDVLESRYADYKKEGGNSFVEHLMEQLRTLPMDPEQSIHKRPKKK